MRRMRHQTNSHIRIEMKTFITSIALAATFLLPACSTTESSEETDPVNIVESQTAEWDLINSDLGEALKGFTE